MATQVKVLRKKAFCGCVTACKVEIDGIIAGQVKNGENTAFEVSEGVHRFCLLDAGGRVLKRGSFTATEGKDIFIEIQFNGSTGKLDVFSEDVVCESKKEKTANKAVAVLLAIAALCLVAIIAITLMFPDSFKGPNKASKASNTDVPTSTQSQYEQVDLQGMLDELDANALRAEETYQDKYIEITGEIISFDSDGKYISIVPCGGSVWNEWVKCNLTDTAHKTFLLEKSVGDVVTIRGKVYSIGEVLGYSIEIIEISD